jgi:hypothetical protein
MIIRKLLAQPDQANRFDTKTAGLTRIECLQPA